MTDSLPGWYVDPSGLPDTFRWWDGRQWTQALTTDPSAPVPIDPVPVVPPGEHPTEPEPSQHQPYRPRPSPMSPLPPSYGGQFGSSGPSGSYGDRPPGGAIPPPPGSPGPDYVPPPFEPIGPGRTEVLGSEPDGAGRDGDHRVLLIGGIGGAILLVLVLLGGYVLFFSDDDSTPTASDTPGVETPGPSNPPTRTPAPPPTPPKTPDPQDPGDTPKPDPQTAPQLEYQRLPRPWGVNQNVTNATYGDLSGAIGQARVTEPNYQGNTDWVAMVGAGPCREEWLVTDDGGSTDLEGTADTAAQWFSENSFGDATVEREPADIDPLEVSGQQGVLLKEHISYDIDSLDSTGETVYVAVVDLGEGTPPGVFVASVPDTHEQLLDDVDEAVESLQVNG